jgi:hypothetical protein
MPFPKQAAARLNRGAGIGCSPSSRTANTPRDRACACTLASSGDSTGVTHASRPANIASHSSRDRPAKMAEKRAFIAGHCARSCCAGNGRRPDIDFATFRDYYSNHHVHLMNRLLAHGAAVHRRNFVLHPGAPPGEYDVVSEVFYEDRATAEATMREMAAPEVHRQRIEDEMKFLLPESMRVFMVETDTTVFRPLDGIAP